MDLANWLFGVPQFWLGFVACAALLLIAMTPTTLARPRTRVEVYRIPDRAPAHRRDPFHKPHRRTSQGKVRIAASGKTVTHPASREPAPRPDAIREARKRAVWHPHPDDDLPNWKLLW